MTLAEALAPDVAERTRVKGNRYFLGGAVRGIEGTDTDVVATVRGSEWYSVHLHRDGDAFTATCQCPYFKDRLDFCKHVWAVVLAADAEGLLLGDTPLTPDAYLEIRHDRDAPAGGSATRAARAGARAVAAVSPLRPGEGVGAGAALRQPIFAGRDPLRHHPVLGAGRRGADGAGPSPDA